MKRSLFGVAAIAAFALSVVLIGTAAAKPPAPAAGNNTCPTNPKNLPTANNVGASFADAGLVRTYSFESFTPEAETSAGVPGLVNYCVYTNATPTALVALAEGDDGSDWTASKLGKNFSFSRPGGNKTNIRLDGTSTDIGTATFGILPTQQTIVLHISDPICGAAVTCFVLPGTKPGPVCNAAAAGDSNAAYNNIPKDAVDCGPPSEAFEAQSVSEFGDEVTLTGSGKLQSLSVLFNSYACADAPQWNNGQCATLNPNATFTHEITANIYGASSGGAPGPLLASATETKTFPFRPSADLTLCKDGNNAPTGAFFNPISGNCEFSKKVVHTFTDWKINGIPVIPNLSGNVVWTVAYNTTHYGYSPIGEGASCFGVNGGCGYDSLNVGTKTFQGAPYAGGFADASDAFVNSSWTGGYCDNGSGGTGTLRQDAPCWTGFQPLGRIVLEP